jgi:CubicO group peptidase (beta-lactamase class C family)
LRISRSAVAQLVCGVWLAGFVLAVPAPAREATLGKRLDAVIDQSIKDRTIVGTVVLILHDGKVVYHRAAGMADREAGRPMTEDAVLRIASMTKPIVSAATLKLVDEGKLGLDDAVSRWIPEFKPKLADGTEPAITVRHLLTHTAGLTYVFLEAKGGPYHRLGVSDGLDRSGFSLVENLRRIAAAPLLYKPGTSFSYSLATDVLGEVISRAAGAPLHVVVKRTVTVPLGMKDSGFVATEPARLTAAYAARIAQPLRMPEPFEFERIGGLRFSPSRALDESAYPSGGAGMVATARDYAAFLEALRKGGAPILPAERARAMVTDQLAGMGVPEAPGDGFGFGFGVITDAAAAKTPAHTGTFHWSGVWGTQFWVDPEARLTAVILTNTAGVRGKFFESVRDAVYAAP